MPDPIHQLNSTYNSQFQGQWFVDARACYRPPADLQIPIVCYVQVDRLNKIKNPSPSNASTTAVSIQDSGSDFMLFRECCPSTSDAPAIYRLDDQCGIHGGPACFTTSETRAGLWRECLQIKFAERVKELEDRGDFSLSEMSRDAVTGLCEYVDYERLGKGAGVLNPGRVERSGASSCFSRELQKVKGLWLSMRFTLLIGVMLFSLIL